MVKDENEDLKDKIEEFSQLIKGEQNLKVRTDDNFILRHIRAAEGNVSNAFEKMKTYYLLKKEHPDWYASDPPSTFKRVLDMGSDYILDDRDFKGRRVWIHKARCIDTSKTTIQEMSKMHDLLLETILDEDETQRNGLAVLVDLKDFPWSLMKWLTTGNARISSKKADSLPFPKLEYHIVNTSLLFSIILKFVYPFLSARQKESLFIHGDNYGSLHEHIDASILPEEFGGKKPNESSTKLYDLVCSNAEQLAGGLLCGVFSGYRMTVVRLTQPWWVHSLRQLWKKHDIDKRVYYLMVHVITEPLNTGVCLQPRRISCV